MNVISMLLLVVALVFFAMGFWSRWWPAAPSPYYPSLMSGGLFFWVLSILWGQIAK